MLEGYVFPAAGLRRSADKGGNAPVVTAAYPWVDERFPLSAGAGGYELVRHHSDAHLSRPPRLLGCMPRRLLRYVFNHGLPTPWFCRR